MINGVSDPYTTNFYTALISISPQVRVQLIDILHQTLANTAYLFAEVSLGTDQRLWLLDALLVSKQLGYN